MAPKTALAVSLSFILAVICFAEFAANTPRNLMLISYDGYKLIVDREVYHASDGILADYIFENVHDRPVVIVPPSFIRMTGGILGGTLVAGVLGDSVAF